MKQFEDSPAAGTQPEVVSCLAEQLPSTHPGTCITGWWCNNHLEKYEFVNGVGTIPYILDNKQCLNNISNSNTCTYQVASKVVHICIYFMT